MITDVSSSFYLHLEVADRPGVLARIAEVLGATRSRSRASSSAGSATTRLVMVLHEAPERRFYVALEEIAALDFLRAAPRAIRVIEEEFARGSRRGCRPALIERYRDRLPLEAGDPVVTLNEGSTPLVEAPVLSERVGARVLLKLEGRTRPAASRTGDDGRGLARRRRGGGGDLRLDRQHRGERRRLRRPAGLRGAVIVPEGKIAIGKLAQALMHGARVIALRGNFDEALEIVRELADAHPVELVNSVNPYRIEGQKTAAFEVVEELGEAPGALAIPVGNAGNVTAWRRGFSELGAAPDALRLPGRGAAPLVHGAPVANPRDRRLGDPDRQPGALGGGDGSVHRARGGESRRSPTSRSSTPTGCSPRARASSASRPRRPR